MKRIVNIIILYIWVTAVTAITLSFIICNIVCYFLPYNHAFAVMAEIVSYLLTIIIVARYVRCYPLHHDIHQKHWFRLRYLQ